MTDRPAPVPTPETVPYWAGTLDGRLVLPRCEPCARVVFPPRPCCPGCAGPTTWTELSGRARLVSYVISHRPPPGWGSSEPFVIALVELDEGVRMMSNLVGVAADPAALPLDLELEVAFEPRGDQAVPVFAPVEVAA